MDSRAICFLFLTMTRVVIQGSVQSGESYADVNCYYCGIADNCEIPYYKDEGALIKCDKSCLKFDGYARDGKRIVVRNCGYFYADECVEGSFFEDETTIGTICHCLEDSCNLATQSCQVTFVIFISTALLTFLYN